MNRVYKHGHCDKSCMLESEGWVQENNKQICWWFVEDFSNDTSKLYEKKHTSACLQIWTTHLEMPTTPYSNICALATGLYFKVLYHSIHDVSLSIWVTIVKKMPGQNTPEKTLQVNLLKKFHWKIFIRLSGIIYKSVLGWLSLNESQYISLVKKIACLVFILKCIAEDQHLIHCTTHSMWY